MRSVVVVFFNRTDAGIHGVYGPFEQYAPLHAFCEAQRAKGRWPVVYALHDVTDVYVLHDVTDA